MPRELDDWYQDAEEDGDAEESYRVEAGEICSTCGAEFTEANGCESLCQDCFDAAEELGEPHPPLSRFPVSDA